MRHLASLWWIATITVVIMLSCKGESQQNSGTVGRDSLQTLTRDTIQSAEIEKPKDQVPDNTAKNKVNDASGDIPQVFIYNFHLTNRCVSCIAIEDATTKTLNTYFQKEIESGQVKRFIIDVDDKANAKISEKYQAFGSGLFITRSYKGKETTVDLTGEGFKLARNKEEKFIELVKNQISQFLSNVQ